MVKSSPKKSSQKSKKTAAKKAPAKTAKSAAKKPALKIVPRSTVPAKASRKTPKAAKPSGVKNLQEFMRDNVVKALDDGKAEDIICIDVRGQSAITDFLVIATGRSSRAVNALSDTVEKALQKSGARQIRNEGKAAGDWAVVDGGDVIVHIFRPEVRAFYRLEEVWGLEPPLQATFKDL